MTSIATKILFTLVFLFSLIYASWHVSHGDIRFTADIGRDFHLLREVDEKKFILIGPRSSTGLFHGPAWTYLNYPAFVLGDGNPVTVGWFWILISIMFVIGNFFIARALFNSLAGYFFAGMTAIYIGHHAHEFINPHGALLLMPLFFYLFIKFHRTKNLRFLILHLLTGGLMLQFQLAIGIPFLLLSVLYILYTSVRTKNKKILLGLLILPLLISNFIIFDLKYQFLYTKKVFAFLNPQVGEKVDSYGAIIYDRILNAFQGTEILRHDAYGFLNLIFFLTVLVTMILLLQKNKHKDIYISFLYFYFGFFLLSFVNKGYLLSFYIFPLFPLTFLMMASFIDTKYKNYAIGPLLIILLINLITSINNIKAYDSIIGKDLYSWKFLLSASNKIFEGDENEIGYFVYSADTFAYEGRYAMIYAQEKHAKRSSYFTKKQYTYLLIAPTIDTRVVTGDAWWTKNRIRITSKPVNVIPFANGYKIEKYKLTDAETKIPFDSGIDLGIHFR